MLVTASVVTTMGWAFTEAAVEFLPVVIVAGCETLVVVVVTVSLCEVTAVGVELTLELIVVCSVVVVGGMAVVVAVSD
jgi:hypothetical protein